MKKVLIVASTTEERFNKKKEYKKKWGDNHQMNAAGIEHAIGVFDSLVPDIIIICPAPGSVSVYEKLEGKISGGQLLFRDGHDQLPAMI